MDKSASGQQADAGSDSAVSAKMEYDGAFRRFKFEVTKDGKTLNNLTEMVSKVTGLTKFKLFWIDEDNDKVLLTCEEEIIEAVPFLSPTPGGKKPLLRLVVEPIEEPVPVNDETNGEVPSANEDRPSVTTQPAGVQPPLMYIPPPPPIPPFPPQIRGPGFLDPFPFAPFSFPHPPFAAAETQEKSQQESSDVPPETKETKTSATTNQELVMHSGVSCDECDFPICGHRFKCMICDNYDLCASCERLGIHSEHAMLRIAHPTLTVLPSGLAARSALFPTVAKLLKDAVINSASNVTLGGARMSTDNLSKIGNHIMTALGDLGIDASYEVRDANDQKVDESSKAKENEKQTKSQCDEKPKENAEVKPTEVTEKKPKENKNSTCVLLEGISKNKYHFKKFNKPLGTPFQRHGDDALRSAMQNLLRCERYVEKSGKPDDSKNEQMSDAKKKKTKESLSSDAKKLETIEPKVETTAKQQNDFFSREMDWSAMPRNGPQFYQHPFYAPFNRDARGFGFADSRRYFGYEELQKKPDAALNSDQERRYGDFTPRVENQHRHGRHHHHFRTPSPQRRCRFGGNRHSTHFESVKNRRTSPTRINEWSDEDKGYRYGFEPRGNSSGFKHFGSHNRKHDDMARLKEAVGRFVDDRSFSRRSPSPTRFGDGKGGSSGFSPFARRSPSPKRFGDRKGGRAFGGGGFGPFSRRSPSPTGFGNRIGGRFGGGFREFSRSPSPTKFGDKKVNRDSSGLRPAKDQPLDPKPTKPMTEEQTLFGSEDDVSDSEYYLPAEEFSDHEKDSQQIRQKILAARADKIRRRAYDKNFGTKYPISESMRARKHPKTLRCSGEGLDDMMTWMSLKPTTKKDMPAKVEAETPVGVAEPEKKGDSPHSVQSSPLAESSFELLYPSLQTNETSAQQSENVVRDELTEPAIINKESKNSSTTSSYEHLCHPDENAETGENKVESSHLTVLTESEKEKKEDEARQYLIAMGFSEESAIRAVEVNSFELVNCLDFLAPPELD